MCMGKCPFCRAQFTITRNENDEEEVAYSIFLTALLCMTFLVMVVFIPLITLKVKNDII
jgi:hypothetical protein